MIFGAALRRWIAVLCVSWLVFSGYAHSACFVPSGTPTYLVQVSNDVSGETPDSPATAALDGVHCHGCTMAAMPMDAQPLSIVDVVSKPVAAVTVELWATDRQFDPPPPKA